MGERKKSLFFSWHYFASTITTTASIIQVFVLILYYSERKYLSHFMPNPSIIVNTYGYFQPFFLGFINHIVT